jgi:hypothetical protein
MSRELRFSDKKRPTTFKKPHEFIPIDPPQKVLMENLGLSDCNFYLLLDWILLSLNRHCLDVA